MLILDGHVNQGKRPSPILTQRFADLRVRGYIRHGWANEVRQPQGRQGVRDLDTAADDTGAAVAAVSGFEACSNSSPMTQLFQLRWSQNF